MNKEEQGKFIEQIYKELDDYKVKMLKLEKGELYERAYNILAHEELGNFVIYNADKYSREGFEDTNIVESLFSNFMGTSYNLTQDDLKAFVDEETKSLLDYKKYTKKRNLAEKIYNLYSNYADYDKFDEFGTFNDDSKDNIIIEIEMSLSKKDSRQKVVAYLSKIIENDERENIQNEAKELKKQVKELYNENEM